MRRPYQHRPYWSKNMERRLVALYKDAPQLWDPRAKSDVCRNDKHEILRQIAAKIGKDISSEEISYKLKYYRDYFHRESRKVLTTKITASNMQEVYKPTWCLFESLKFLDVQLDDQDYDSTQGDVTDENEQATNCIISESEVPMGDHDYYEINDSIIVVTPSLDFQPSSEIDTGNLSSHPTPSRNRKSSPRKRSVAKPAETLAIAESNNQSTEIVIPLDANPSTALFANYVSERLAYLDDEQKNWAMFKISEVLFKASKREYYMQ